MTRLSRYLLPTEKEAPADAEALSHRLMVRAGLVRQVGSGLWTWLPAGWRVHQRISAIVREELDAIGALEMLMPVIQPAELWKRTGRYPIEELFKLNDRRGAELVLAMTHEEVVTSHVAQVVRSYRDLPLILYRDQEGLEHSYARHIEAYDRIFERAGLRWYRVAGDVGVMGGTGAHEYMAPCAAGENEVALAPGYAANVEVATAQAKPVELPAALGAPAALDTPGATTIAAVGGLLGLEAGAMLKAFPVHVEERGLVLVMLRGDHRVNEIKLAAALAAPWRPASAEEIASRIGPPGFIGPVGVQLPVLLDAGVTDGPYVTGANLADTHLRGVEPGRDFAYERVDVRSVEAGDLVGGVPITIEPAIEVGNIFQLGTRYSKALGASFLDEQGAEQPIWMG